MWRAVGITLDGDGRHATEDEMIPPEAQRAMARRAGAAVTEAESSHPIYVSDPQVVAKLIEQAASAK